MSPQAYTSTFDGRRAGWNHDHEAFMFEWPKFSAAACPTMIFDNETIVKNNPDTVERKALVG